MAAGSGTGKSVFALTLAIRSEAKTIYFSADSGPGTQLARAVSMVTGRPEADARSAIQSGHLFENETIEIRRIRWDFNAGPTLDSIEKSLEAYGFLHGEFPELVVVDNLMNVVPDDSGEGGRVNKENVLLFLAELARDKGCCIVVLHHVIGQYDDGMTPIPMSGLMEKTSKTPEMILTLHRIEDPMRGEMLGVCVVKNRGGTSHAGGNKIVELPMDLSFMSIKDPEYNNQGPLLV